MEEKGTTTQEAILLATIDCINENGIEHLTTRMIAEKAGANIASINYYFRTKDLLVNQALEITIRHMLEDVNETISDQNMDFREILKDVIYYMISGASTNMGITSAHLYRLVIDKDYDSVSATSFLTAFNNLLERAIDQFPDRDPDHLKKVLASIFSAIMFMMLTPFFFQLGEDKLISEEDFHRDMAEHYTEMFYSMIK